MIYKRLLKYIAKSIPGYLIRRQLFRMAGYKIGNDVFIGEDLIIKDELEDRGSVIIGNRVAIADRVTLVTVSYPNASIIRSLIDETHGHIEIKDDAWLCSGCIILPNVRIGKGAVIAAGSVVTKDVPDFTVVGGVPATKIQKLEIEGK